MLQLCYAVGGHVLNTLLGPMLDNVAELFCIHVLNVATQIFQQWVERNGTDGNRNVVDDFTAGIFDVLASRQVRDGVSTMVDGRVQFL